jgi:hypothetical protein
MLVIFFVRALDILLLGRVEVLPLSLAFSRILKLLLVFNIVYLFGVFVLALI